ncbi:MAG TPA: 16S rRNA (guanine(527)-N(7))-methyltransferase RsmG [Firmicutes bacterium]|nr:16S rRNA (guanine(527)-N(7))-methyltransferase RsmG [Bacillota bacterium]
MDRLQFENWIKSQFEKVSDEQLANFDLYYHLLTAKNNDINLLSRATGLDIYEKHFSDSLLFSLPESLRGKTIIDLGSGAGFPGIPLKIMYPDNYIYLLEPTRKRADFLKVVIAKLDLKKIEVINERAEDFVASSREMFDGLVARAVAPLNILLELASPLVKVGGLVLAYKGERADQELIEADMALKVLNLKVTHQLTSHLPTLQHTRNLLIFEKEAPTPIRYPRLYAAIKIRPL